MICLIDVHPDGRTTFGQTAAEASSEKELAI
jgi:hypothetical protein